MSTPQVPPRPARSHHQPNPPIAGMEVPKIPPRPNRRTSDRSQSPHRDTFARSPFHEPPLGMSHGNRSGGLYATNSQNNSSSDLPRRPPSVSLPSVGQEGNEYANIDEPDVKEPTDASNPNQPKETRNIAGDLPLHAPKAAFAQGTAAKRVAQVTRTDSGQAAAAGIGKFRPPSISADDKDPDTRPLKPKVSFRTASSVSTERPGSAQAEEDHGIPEIGQRVPMYPDAGDVQAPSPAPDQSHFPAVIGFHNAGRAKPGRHHRRTPSGKEVLPPGSYGLHGHGLQSADQFEQSWYAKHPEALEREEHGEYGPGIGGGRGEWALSSDDLNKLVRETSRMTQAAAGAPNEQYGYEEAARLYTPQSAGLRSNSQPHHESPLRKASFPVNPEGDVAVQEVRSSSALKRMTGSAMESETEDDDIDGGPPTTRSSKHTGNRYNKSREALASQGGIHEDNAGYREYNDDGVPILASDEVARTPGAEFMQPAVTPTASRRGSAYYPGIENDQYAMFRANSRSGSASNSQPSSRPGSVHGVSLSRHLTHEEDRENMHTPLEDVDEYEPLFPDEDGKKKPVTATQRLKLREHLKRFPSQDIWEDTPNSLQLQATVDTPEPEKTQAETAAKAPTAVFETPQQEAARKGEVSEAEKAKLLSKEERMAKSNFKPHLRDEMHRPGMRQRFPSKDIWEDSPDSAELTTTVGGDASTDVRSPPDAGLEAGAVVATSGSPKDGIIAGEQARDGASAGAPAMEPKPTIPPRPMNSKASADFNQQPPVPARPPKRLHQVPPADAKVPVAPSKLNQSTSPTEQTDLFSPTDTRKGPSLPERAKPQVPSRPVKASTQDQPDSAPLSKVTSTSSVGSEGSEKGAVAPPAAPKPKPAVPARPAGGKIAALQGGFLADLNSRLKGGPPAPKPQEKEVQAEEEKAPLADARKGRAKGPARRKPVAAAEAGALESKPTDSNWGICPPVTVWQTDANGQIRILVPEPTASTLKSSTVTTDAAKADLGPKVNPTTEQHQPSNEESSHPTLNPESIKSPLSPSIPEPTSADLPTPHSEKSHNPLSIAPNTPDLPPTATSAIQHEDAARDFHSPLAANDPISAPSGAAATDEASMDSPFPTSSQGEPATSPSTAEQKSQTGEKDITIQPGTGGEEKMTAIIGGKADAEEGEAANTIVRDVGLSGKEPGAELS